MTPEDKSILDRLTDKLAELRAENESLNARVRALEAQIALLSQPVHVIAAQTIAYAPDVFERGLYG